MAQKRIQAELNKPLELTAEKKEIVEGNINQKFYKAGQLFKKSLRQTGSFEPFEAFSTLLGQRGLNEDVIEKVWMALTSTDVEDA